jgi:hypothetical protein
MSCVMVVWRNSCYECLIKSFTGEAFHFIILFGLIIYHHAWSKYFLSPWKNIFLSVAWFSSSVWSFCIQLLLTISNFRKLTKRMNVNFALFIEDMQEPLIIFTFKHVNKIDNKDMKKFHPIITLNFLGVWLIGMSTGWGMREKYLIT